MKCGREEGRKSILGVWSEKAFACFYQFMQNLTYGKQEKIVFKNPTNAQGWGRNPSKAESGMAASPTPLPSTLGQHKGAASHCGNETEQYRKLLDTTLINSAQLCPVLQTPLESPTGLYIQKPEPQEHHRLQEKPSFWLTQFGTSHFFYGFLSKPSNECNVLLTVLFLNAVKLS